MSLTKGLSATAKQACWPGCAWRKLVVIKKRWDPAVGGGKARASSFRDRGHLPSTPVKGPVRSSLHIQVHNEGQMDS